MGEAATLTISKNKQTKNPICNQPNTPKDFVEFNMTFSKKFLEVK
jgi:hypothetical protein